MFNSKILFDNISFLVKSNNTKIGELESHANVSAGYISRTSKDDGAKPGVDFVVNVADYFNISIDTLINVQINAITPTERYLITFFEKLKKDTIEGQLRWLKYTPDALNYLESDINGFVDHPLMEYESFTDLDEEGFPTEVTRTVMDSNTFGMRSVIAGDSFELKMANNTSIHLMNLCKSIYKVNDQESHSIEIWSTTSGESPQFLASNVRRNNLNYLVDDLYQAVFEDSKHPRLNDRLKYAIDSYLDNGINIGDKNYNDLPF